MSFFVSVCLCVSLSVYLCLSLCVSVYPCFFCCLSLSVCGLFYRTFDLLQRIQSINRCSTFIKTLDVAIFRLHISFNADLHFLLKILRRQDRHRCHRDYDPEFFCSSLFILSFVPCFRHTPANQSSDESAGNHVMHRYRKWPFD